MLPGNLSMTDHFKSRNIKNRKQKYAVEAGNRITSAWKWLNLLRHACITKMTTNKTKMTANDSGGIIRKSNRWTYLNQVAVLFSLEVFAAQNPPRKLLMLVITIGQP
jgi:hypothetical protein